MLLAFWGIVREDPAALSLGAAAAPFTRYLVGSAVNLLGHQARGGAGSAVATLNPTI